MELHATDTSAKEGILIKSQECRQHIVFMPHLLKEADGTGIMLKRLTECFPQSSGMMLNHHVMEEAGREEEGEGGRRNWYIVPSFLPSFHPSFPQQPGVLPPSKSIHTHEALGGGGGGGLPC